MPNLRYVLMVLYLLTQLCVTYPNTISVILVTVDDSFVLFLNKKALCLPSNWGWENKLISLCTCPWGEQVVSPQDGTKTLEVTVDGKVP